MGHCMESHLQYKKGSQNWNPAVSLLFSHSTVLSFADYQEENWLSLTQLTSDPSRDINSVGSDVLCQDLQIKTNEVTA